MKPSQFVSLMCETLTWVVMDTSDRKVIVSLFGLTKMVPEPYLPWR